MAGLVIGVAGLIMGIGFNSYFATQTVLSHNYENQLQKAAGRTQVRLYTGWDPRVGEDWGGNHPGISLWDEDGRYIGHENGNSKIVNENSYVDLVVPHKKELEGVSAGYISISNGGNDAICIAQIDMAFPDGTLAQWGGDMAMYCANKGLGAQVFPSKHAIGKERLQPWCVWIDRDGSDGLGKLGSVESVLDFRIPTKYQVGNQG